MVRLKPPGDPNAARRTEPLPPKVTLQAPTPPPLIAAVANGVGNVVLVGKSFAVGSSLTAGRGYHAASLIERRRSANLSGHYGFGDAFEE